MAVILGQNAAQLQLFFTAYETRFWQAYKAAPVMYPKLATTYPVGTEQWVSGWLTMLQKYREWIGSRITHTPNPQTYLVPIKNFELTQGLDKFRFDDDQYGIYSPLPSFMALQAAKWPDYQLRDLLQNQGSWTGPFQNGLDGLTFFNTAHPVNLFDLSQGTYCNDFTDGGVSVNGILVGGAMSATSIYTIYANMSARKSESGEAWGAIPTANLCGPQLKWAQDSILQAQILGTPYMPPYGTGNFPAASAPTPVNAPLIGTSTNMLKGLVESLMWLDLGGSTIVGNGSYDQVFYQVTENLPVKPFSWLLREAPNFIPVIQPNAPLVIEKHMYSWNSEARGSAAWGFSQLASRSGA